LLPTCVDESWCADEAMRLSPAAEALPREVPFSSVPNETGSEKLLRRCSSYL